MATRKLQPITLRSVAFGSISASYSNLGASVDQSLATLKVKNYTDKTIFISEDGTNDHYRLASGEIESIDCQANARAGDVSLKEAGIQFSVRGVSGDLPSSGAVVLQGQYT